MRRLWSIKERSLDLTHQHRNESLFTVGNGYSGTRGTLEEGLSGDLPSTLVHGVFHKAEGQIGPELAPFPNWLWAELTVDGTPLRMVQQSSDIRHPPEGLMLGFRRELNMRLGVLFREVLFRAKSGNVVRVLFERFASMARQHICAQRITVEAVDGDCELEFLGGLDLTPLRQGPQHWRAVGEELQEAQLCAGAGTCDGRYQFAMRSWVEGDREGNLIHERGPAARRAARLSQGQRAAFTKLTVTVTSRDVDENIHEEAREELNNAVEAGYDSLLLAHEQAWGQIWETMDVQIEGDDDAQRALRFALYHTAIAAPRKDHRVSIGARTLSGPGYKGHVFWDTELYIVPALTLTQPAVARNLLLYRYHTLPGARRKAAANGYEGAMFPWESADTGEEVTPDWLTLAHTGERVRVWTGVKEQHISVDVAYAIDQYWRYSGDDGFMEQFGAEMILDTAVFWGSRVERHNGRFEIRDQISPDEYHEGVDNSAFVNRMVVWHLETALKLHRWLADRNPERAAALEQQLKLTPDRLEHWRHIIKEMYVPFDHEQGMHLPFSGFFDLEHIDVPAYTPRRYSVSTILPNERVWNSQMVKQADIVMLMALLGNDLLHPPLSVYSAEEVMQRNWELYAPRCDHGSSLSPAIHAMVAARLGRAGEAYELFELAAGLDLHDTSGGARDGIHAAACGGLYQAVVFGFCGLEISPGGELVVNPQLPEGWRSVRFKVHYQGRWHSLAVGADTVTPAAEELGTLFPEAGVDTSVN